MDGGEGRELIEPLRRPICTQRQFRAWVAIEAAQMLRPPWRVVVKFYDCRKGVWAHSGDDHVYCCTQSQPQYHRVFVHADLWHPGWRDERTVRETIRHELAHSFFTAVNEVIEKYLPEDPVLAKLLDDLEDEAVNRIATMPALEEPDGEA